MISVADRFSRYPGGRYRGRSEHSGQEFRESILVPALERAEREGSKVVVELSGTSGYAMSFLEETFGGLVRVNGYSAARLNLIMEIIASEGRDQYFLEKARQFVADAEAVNLQSVH